MSPFPRPDPTSRSAALTRRHPPPLPPRALHRPQPPRRLNSRTVLAGKGIEVCDAGTYGLHLIARANRRAAAETWNVPQVRLPRAPPRALTPVTDCSLVSPRPPRARRCRTRSRRPSRSRSRRRARRRARGGTRWARRAGGCESGPKGGRGVYYTPRTRDDEAGRGAVRPGGVALTARARHVYLYLFTCICYSCAWLTRFK